jgi:hypothetical protein
MHNQEGPSKMKRGIHQPGGSRRSSARERNLHFLVQGLLDHSHTNVQTHAGTTLLQAGGHKLKDRLGDQRGGSEWEPIKILLKNLAYAPKSLPNNLARTCQDHVVTTDLLTLGTS